MKKIWLMIGLSIGLISIGWAQDDSTKPNPWSPWELKCESVLFPTPNLAYAFLHNRRFKVYYCIAQQKAQSFVRGQWLEGILYIRPISISFDVKMGDKKIKKPAKVIIENEKMVRSFGFYDNCFDLEEEGTLCSFFPENKHQMTQLIEAMSQGKQVKLELKVESSDYPVELVFGTQHFSELFKIVSATYDQMAEIFRTANVTQTTVSN